MYNVDQIIIYNRKNNRNTWEADWNAIIEGLGNNRVMVFRACMLAGNIILCPWKNEYTVDRNTRNMLTLQRMAQQSGADRSCILAHRPTDDMTQYGIPRFFFRLSFTRAFQDIPFCYMRNIKTNSEVSRGQYQIPIYRISETNWSNGPRLASRSSRVNPFVNIGDLTPSRFTLAGSERGHVSFVPVDYEMVDFVSGGGSFYTDLGNDVVGKIDHEEENFGGIASSTLRFLRAKL